MRTRASDLGRWDSTKLDCCADCVDGASIYLVEIASLELETTSALAEEPRACEWGVA